MSGIRKPVSQLVNVLTGEDIDTYKCYLNGSLYGVGDLEYMNELFCNYVVTRKMYGKTKCEFRIVKSDVK